ncbi:hypothetical protein [Candidatus Protofrankia californiensis]|uniref:hypothetical protein n=1 Tax=Candidatus Protofrankia californiensis TaxID=1839754 RepID=UPI0019D06FF6|nr:hypothetical protein [Candidatus Protofrankia californiensis]
MAAALAAGAVSGLSGTATQAVSDAYAALKDLLRRRLVGRGQDPGALDGEEAEAEAWRSRLAGRLAAADVDVDDEVRAAAEQLLAAADPAGYRAGKYAVDLRGAKGVQVGDGNIQNNTFN